MGPLRIKENLEKRIGYFILMVIQGVKKTNILNYRIISVFSE